MVQRLSLLLLTASTYSADAAWSSRHAIQNPILPLRMSTSLRSAPAKPAVSTSSASSSEKNLPWFPRTIQESVDYASVIQSVYLRHVVVETVEMARAALETYREMETEDPFGDLARTISACPLTREEGGKIGWIDLKDKEDSDTNSDSDTTTILPQDIIDQLFQLFPKNGDVHIIESDLTDQVHLVKVEELTVNHRPTLFLGDQPAPFERVGSHTGKNALIPRSKLKGSGVTPELPDFSNDQTKTYVIHTAGCQMNMADTERLAGVLENTMGMKPALPNDKSPDVVVLNTCSIRDHAEQKVYDTLGPYAAQKRSGKKKDMALIVTGCVAQQEGESLLRRVPELDVVIGPQYVPHLKNVLESVTWGHQVVATSPMIHQEDFSKPIRGHAIKAWVNVIYGCNEHCTYCVVPAVRGMEQSRTMESILNECIELSKDGFKEITLLGQNIDAYGRDMIPKRTFADLLYYLNGNIPDGMRIRYVTSHPRYFSDRVIDAVADLDKVCECFHVPVQAGDDEVLKNMRRGYTYKSYMKIINKIRAKAPDASLCGDIIVGFPGETDAAFERTLDLMREVKFDNLNSFAYSTRPNTEAALWENQVPEEVKSERLQKVQKLAAEHGMEKSLRYVGRTLEVLVEDGNPRNSKQVMGRTRQGRQIFFEGNLEELRGELVNVLCTEARTWSLVGQMA